MMMMTTRLHLVVGVSESNAKSTWYRVRCLIQLLVADPKVTRAVTEPGLEVGPGTVEIIRQIRRRLRVALDRHFGFSIAAEISHYKDTRTHFQSTGRTGSLHVMNPGTNETKN